MSRNFKAAGQAAYKLHVYFSDNGTATYYSRDWQNSKFQPEKGLDGLIKYVERNKAKIKTALIYDKQNGRDNLIGKFISKSNSWLLKPENTKQILP